MPLSPSQRRQVEDAETTLRKAVAEDITSAYETIRNHSDVLKRVPADFIEGFAERALAVDESTRESWHQRGDNPERAADTLKRIAGQLEAVVGRIHDDADHPDDGFDDPDIKTAVAYVRDTAQISPRVPSSLIEGVLISAFDRDAEAQRAWEHRASNPTAVNNVLKRVAHGLRPVVDELVLFSRPSADPTDMDGVDAMRLSDREWADHKRRVATANERR